MNVPKQFEVIAGGGGAYKLNGATTDAASILTALSSLDAFDTAMLGKELQDVIDQMKWRLLPFQYIPKGQGLAPTLDLRIPGNHGQSWSLGATWDRKQSG